MGTWGEGRGTWGEGGLVPISTLNLGIWDREFGTWGLELKITEHN